MQAILEPTSCRCRNRMCWEGDSVRGVNGTVLPGRCTRRLRGYLSVQLQDDIWSLAYFCGCHGTCCCNGKVLWLAEV
jgi:hypothetical protein